ncbi:MAG: sulfotransferase [Phycisphaerales bacterium]|nr:sulfotransferase [Phycisphaerales bacterium]
MSMFGGPMSGQVGVINRARALLNASEYQTAISFLREALEKTPRDPEVLRMLGYSLMLFDNCPEAVRHLEFASKLNPGDPDTLCDLAMVYRRLDRLGEAHKALDQVLKVNPANGRAVALKARVLQARGQSPKAMEIVEHALTISKDSSIVMIYGTLARELKQQAPAIDLIRETLQSPTLERVRRSELLFSLGHLLDSVGDYDDAFEAFQTANKMTDPGVIMDFDRHIGNWSKEALESFDQQETDGSRAILVVGMPRSGTTLTEQVLAAHPNAGGIGESPFMNGVFGSKSPQDLTNNDFQACGKGYMDELSKLCPDPKARRVVDKMPENYLFLGQITRAIRGVNLVHCKRDARDTCLSIYFQRFGPGIVYAHDLVTCANQYLGYLQTMQHWNEILEVPIFESKYEELTSDPEPRVRAMLDHVGLEFNKSCLEHHKNKSSVHTASAGQVRKPLYKSSQQRWKNYEKHLGPMLEVLGDVE